MKKFYYSLDGEDLKLYKGDYEEPHYIALDIYKKVFSIQDLAKGLDCTPAIEIFDENKESLGTFVTAYEIEHYCALSD